MTTDSHIFGNAQTNSFPSRIDSILMGYLVLLIIAPQAAVFLNGLEILIIVQKLYFIFDRN